MNKLDFDFLYIMDVIDISLIGTVSAILINMYGHYNEDPHTQMFVNTNAVEKRISTFWNEIIILWVKLK